MNFITIEELNNHYQQVVTKFKGSDFFSDSKFANHKLSIMNVYAFSSTASQLSISVERKFREDLAHVKQSESGSANMPRQQVSAHKLGDVWGYALTLEQSVKFFEKSISATVLLNELIANSESLYRTAEDTLIEINKFNLSKIKSETVSELINHTFSLVNVNDINSLSESALEYFKQLA